MYLHTQCSMCIVCGRTHICTYIFIYMCVHIYLYTFICTPTCNMYFHTRWRMCNVCGRIYTHVLIWFYRYVHTWNVFIYIYIHILTHTTTLYFHTRSGMCFVCGRIYTYVLKYLYVYIYTYIWTHAHNILQVFPHTVEYVYLYTPPNTCRHILYTPPNTCRHTVEYVYLYTPPNTCRHTRHIFPHTVEYVPCVWAYTPICTWWFKYVCTQIDGHTHTPCMYTHSVVREVPATSAPAPSTTAVRMQCAYTHTYHVFTTHCVVCVSAFNHAHTCTRAQRCSSSGIAATRSCSRCVVIV